jgi:hypothetical protein
LEGGINMKCEICERQQVEYIGIICGEHKACMLCIAKLVKEAIIGKDVKA